VADHRYRGPSGRAASLALVALAYVVAGGATWWGASLVGISSPYLALAVGYALATVVIFATSCITGNGSMFDAYWSVIPPVGAVWLATQASGVDGTRTALVLVVVMVWGVRLTANWARGWPGLHHEDWRYLDMYAKAKVPRAVVSLLGVHLFPTVQLWLGSLPLVVALARTGNAVGPLDLVATVVGVGGALLELIADEQMRAFAKVKQPGQVMDRGLWRYSRHPNYLGEIMFWLSLYLFALAVGVGYWWTGIGVVAMVAMFLGASIPMLDDRSSARRPEFAEYRRRTSALIPRPPKRG
jgi:steroid 5-alpha reductase family enzyme